MIEFAFKSTRRFLQFIHKPFLSLVITAVKGATKNSVKGKRFFETGVNCLFGSDCLIHLKIYMSTFKECRVSYVSLED